MTTTSFGARLKVLRMQAGLSQNQLAYASRVTKDTISSLEQGRREPVWGTVVALARALNVPVSAFDVADEGQQQEG